MDESDLLALMNEDEAAERSQQRQADRIPTRMKTNLPVEEDDFEEPDEK